MWNNRNAILPKICTNRQAPENKQMKRWSKVQVEKDQILTIGVIYIIVIVLIKLKYYSINKIIFLSNKKKRKNKRRNATSIIFFIIR